MIFTDRDEVVVSTAIFVISDDEAAGNRLREILRSEGEEVPASRMLRLDRRPARSLTRRRSWSSSTCPPTPSVPWPR